LGRTATVGGAAQIQILNAQYSNNGWIVDVRNLGPGTLTYSSSADWKMYVDGAACSSVSPNPDSGSWTVGSTVKLTCSGGVSTDTTKQHNIVVYGPGGTQAQYLYYPPPS
jgi:hypothetical protein